MAVTQGIRQLSFRRLRLAAVIQVSAATVATRGPGVRRGGRKKRVVCVCVGVCVFLCMFIYVDDYVCLCSCTFMYVYVWSCMLMIMYVYVCLCSEAYIPIQRLWFCIVSRDISWSWTLERSTLETWTGHVLLGSFDIWEREPQTRSGLSLNTG